MKFNGKFKKGVFIPDSSVEVKWKRWVARLERDDIAVSVALNRAERVSDSQLGLLYVIVNMVVDQTGSNDEQVLMNIRHLRPKDGNFNPKRIDTLNTDELKTFIDKSIIHLNKEFNLNVHLELLPSGKTKVKC